MFQQLIKEFMPEEFEERKKQHEAEMSELARYGVIFGFLSEPPKPPNLPNPPQSTNFANFGPIWMKLGVEVRNG